MSCARSLVKVVGLHWSGCDVQFLYVTRSDVDDLIHVLECPLDNQEAGIGHERAISLVETLGR